MRWLGVTLLLVACGATPGGPAPDAGVPDAGVPDAGPSDAGTPDGGTPDAGTPDGGTTDAGTPDGGTTDAGPSDAGTPDGGTTDAGTPDGGTPDGGWLSLAFTSGPAALEVLPRVNFAGLRLAVEGSTTAILELSRDTAGTSRRRLVVRRDGAPGWSRLEQDDEQFNDVAVHPSGEVTLAVERRGRSRDALELLRLDASGGERTRQALPRPTIPPGDLADGGTGAGTFAMVLVRDGSMVHGWLPWFTVRAAGEDVVAGLLTHAERPDGMLAEVEVVSAVMWLTAGPSGYVERWSRVVDAVHGLAAVAWQYDEFLWMDAASRPVVDVTPREVVVGRTLLPSRCRALERLSERTAPQCRVDANKGSPHRYQPFAWTRFSRDGVRLGTAVVSPDELEELVVFDMAVRGEQVALAGTVVRIQADGQPRYYTEPPDSTPMSPYDGLLAVADLDSGALTWTRELDLGRGEFLASVRWTAEGLLAGGAADWNRWWGGMSLSRGADPLLVLAPLDGGTVLTRTLPVEPGDRHAYVRAVATVGHTVLGVGPGDAPMTHSGDVAVAPMALGGLTLTLTPR